MAQKSEKSAKSRRNCAKPRQNPVHGARAGSCAPHLGGGAPSKPKKRRAKARRERLSAPPHAGRGSPSSTAGAGLRPSSRWCPNAKQPNNQQPDTALAAAAASWVQVTAQALGFAPAFRWFPNAAPRLVPGAALKIGRKTKCIGFNAGRPSAEQRFLALAGNRAPVPPIQKTSPGTRPRDEKKRQ